MVWTKSGTTRHHPAGDTDCDSGTARNNSNSECHRESVHFFSTGHRNSTNPNAAARISESRADGGTGGH